MDNATILKRMADEKAEFVAYQTAHARPQDWPEDYTFENGCYECCCGYCGRGFLGYKRRFACKICDRAMNELL